MLYRPEAFERLTDEPWRADRVRAGIREIVRDTDDALRGPKLLWRADDWDRWLATSPLKTLYVGAAGVLWALDELRRRGHAETRLDLPGLALRALERQRGRPDFGSERLPSPPSLDERESSLLCGEAGVLLVACRLGPCGEHSHALYGHVRANVANATDELMWGSPGTMVIARLLLDWTGDLRWRRAWEESAQALLARRDGDGMWTQRLYGTTRRFLGPAHGFVGNVHALLPLLAARNRADLVRIARDVLGRTAIVENGLANWPAVVGQTGDGDMALQWCHGAPGIVVAAADYLDEDLLLAGAELTWRAGAHRDEKGSSICHGTAGNGYAFLKAFARTGDERWLDRARRFAVHALAQARRQRESRGRGRYSLWTGDLGVALYLADCLDERTAYPVIDA